ncbi:hypothetical protein DPEC_G00249660 [Dallia pectoralis]|uniref:Uncharacterized protein n=1 Tax=Dallia pectoralis TaxID=75939 RepID=A0ACC2FSZ1_DALPE|nr:hypothetical protein DPEC_G00249660 [Dallia pectoralis]
MTWICRNQVSEQFVHGNHEASPLTVKPCSTDDNQQGSEWSQTKKRPWCRRGFISLFLFLVVMALMFFFEYFKSFTLDWKHVTVPTPHKAVAVKHLDKFYVEYPHEYHFILDEPEKCGEENPFLVLMVPVAPYNREARDAIRSTWGTERQVLGKEVRLFFLLGLPSGEGADQLQVKVSEESRDHRDLLQSDFIDCYKNLTIKTMMMMEWLSSRCPNASYAMKIDSDMFLNVNTLVNMLLQHQAENQNFMTGSVAVGAAVLRDPDSKWYLPLEAFPEPVYPPYTLGLGYVFSLDLPRKLLEASRHVKAVYIEDVYLGLCMRHLGIRPKDPPSWKLFRGYAGVQDGCHYRTVITTILSSSQQLLDVWKDFKRVGPAC